MTLASTSYDNRKLIQDNTDELKKFNKSSTILSTAMIFLAIVQILIGIISITTTP